METDTATDCSSQKGKVYIPNHIAEYTNLISTIEQEIDKKRKAKEPGVKTLLMIKTKLNQMKKQVPRLTKRKDVPISDESGEKTRKNMFTSLYTPNEKLAAFLKSSEPVKRSDVISAIFAYIHFKPDETRETMLRWKHLNPTCERDLRSKTKPGVIEPDETLRNLLNIDEYVASVTSGHVNKRSKNRESGVYENVQVADVELRFWVISKLITPLLTK